MLGILPICLCAIASPSVVLPSAVSPSVAQPAADSTFRVERLAEGVYAVIRLEPAAVINESNSLFIIGDHDVVVVDAQSSAARTRATIAALRALTPKPVRAVINTHWHDDHVVGNAEYLAAWPTVEIIAHATVLEDLATDGVRYRKEADAGRAGTIGFLNGLVQQNRSFAGGPLSEEERRSHLSAARLLADYANPSPGMTYMPAAPTRTLTDRLVLEQGKRRIEVRFMGRGHTRGDVIVHLPTEGIVAAGDLLMWPVQFVGTTSWPLEFGATVDAIRALRPRLIVPGHGPVLRDDTYPALVSRMLHSLSSQARASVARGDTLQAALRSISLAEFETEMAGESPVRRILFSYYVTGSAIKRAWEQAQAR